MDLKDDDKNERAGRQSTDPEFGDSGKDCIDNHNESSIKSAVPTICTTTITTPTENMASYVYDNCQYTKSNVIAKEFNSIKDAEDFYSTYSKSLGFNIRKDIARYDKHGIVTVRRWVCSKQGYRSQKWLNRTDRVREPRTVTREGCLAAFRVGYDRVKRKWVVTEFVDSHIHELASSYQVQFLRSHQSVEEPELAGAKSLYCVGVKTSQIKNCMVDMSGEYENVGFTLKDLQNRLDVSPRTGIMNIDAETCIAYLYTKQETDPGFFFQYTLDAETRVSNLFWCDGGSRADYHCFGDVMVLNSTYRNNAYLKPLVILAGSNHHCKITVFGFALLCDETVDTFTWLLETFLTAMDKKMPKSVITVDDEAMHKAIAAVMPDSTHRLCCWHLEQNIQEKISDPNFTCDFKDCMLTYMPMEDFDRRWFDLINKYGICDNEWAKKVYDERKLWAESFLRGNFFGGMRSTQCESMNAYLNQLVQSKLKLVDFVRQINRSVSRIRHIEAIDDFESSGTYPILCTHLRSYEEHAANVYTRAVFKLVCEQIHEEGLLIMSGCMLDNDRRIYNFTKFKHKDLSWTVMYNQIDSNIVCSCKFFETVGIPCSHSFAVMKAEHLTEIPSCLILSRWTKAAKVSSDMGGQPNQLYAEAAEIARLGSLSVACRIMCHFAAKSFGGFKEAQQDIHRLTLRMQELMTSNPVRKPTRCNVEDKSDIVLDPIRVKTKHLVRTSKQD